MQCTVAMVPEELNMQVDQAEYAGVDDIGFRFTTTAGSPDHTIRVETGFGDDSEYEVDIDDLETTMPMPVDYLVDSATNIMANFAATILILAAVFA